MARDFMDSGFRSVFVQAGSGNLKNGNAVPESSKLFVRVLYMTQNPILILKAPILGNFKSVRRVSGCSRLITARV